MHSQLVTAVKVRLVYYLMPYQHIELEIGKWFKEDSAARLYTKFCGARIVLQSIQTVCASVPVKPFCLCD
jgi:hypothetical protein